MDFLKFAVKEKYPFDVETLLREAASQGHLNVLDWCLDYCFMSARIGHLLCRAAVLFGHVNVLKWAKEKGVLQWDDEKAYMAAFFGYSEILEWLPIEFLRLTPELCSAAAASGKFELFRWIAEKGCPWDEKTIQSGCESGSLEIVRWATERGCPWDEEALKIAEENGHEDILSFLQNKRLEVW